MLFGIFNQHSICHNQCTATMLRIQKANAIGNIEWPYQRTGRRISSEKDQMGDKQGKRKEGWEGEKGVEYISNTSRIGEKKHGNWINDNDNDAIILEPRFFNPPGFATL